MADTASITIHKSFMYRGDREEYDTTHHLDQVPSSTANWDALAEAVVSIEQFCLPSSTWFAGVTGHAPGNPVAVYEKDMTSESLIGTFVPSALEFAVPGDCAATVRWGTTQLSTRG